MKTRFMGALTAVRNKIQRCSDKDHVQQVAYTTYHDGLTQICFSCGVVRTSISEEEIA